MKKKCPCGSKHTYENCCKPFHTQKKIPQNPKQLLFSRYSAYALDLNDYIINTTYDKTQTDPIQWACQILEFSHNFEFLGVKIYKIKQEEAFATIHFKAILKKDNQDASFTETSLFIKDHGTWFYKNPIN